MCNKAWLIFSEIAIVEIHQDDPDVTCKIGSVIMFRFFSVAGFEYLSSDNFIFPFDYTRIILRFVPAVSICLSRVHDCVGVNQVNSHKVPDQACTELHSAH